MAATLKHVNLFWSFNFLKICNVNRLEVLKIHGLTVFRYMRCSRTTIGEKNLRGRRATLSSLFKKYAVEQNSFEFAAVQKELRDVSGIDDELKHKPEFPHGDPQSKSGKKSKHQKCESSIRFQEPVTSENLRQLLAEKVTPLYNIPYEGQLKKKYSACRKILRNVGWTLSRNANVHVGSDLLPCALESIVPSPVTEKYRNKDEFSIRHGIDGNPKTVGLFIDSIAKNPDTLCVDTDEIIIIKESHKALAKDFENYIRQSSLDACLNFGDGGHWRNIIVRSNIQGEVMAIVTMHPQELTLQQREDEKQKLKEYFLSMKHDRYNLKSLYFQECFHTRCTSAESPFQLLFGDDHIFEQLNGMKFRISPESFFQTNTLSAEYLMKVIYNLCQARRSSVILDICCGTGPISLTFAPYVKKCIGIDVCSQAIEDAKANAEINDIRNTEFHVGKSEDLINRVLNEVYGEEFIAIVNPSRSSLGKSAIHALRSIKYLTKVLYVSCKPSAAIENYVELCKLAGKKSELGKPFYPMMAVPVDLFPHTNHCELAILFQRL